MPADDAAIFIDSQQYIDLYRLSSGKELLAPLDEQKNYIFITEQIVNEVNKHKLSEAMNFLGTKCRIGNPPGCELPDHLFNDWGASVAKIHAKVERRK